MVIMGAATNIVTGYLVSRVELRTLVVVSGFVTIAAPLVMATLKIHDSYWTGAFWGLFLSPVNSDGTSGS